MLMTKDELLALVRLQIPDDAQIRFAQIVTQTEKIQNGILVREEKHFSFSLSEV